MPSSSGPSSRVPSSRSEQSRLSNSLLQAGQSIVFNKNTIDSPTRAKEKMSIAKKLQ